MSLRSPWFAGYGSLPASSLRLFCFPHAGAGCSAFRAWPSALPDIEVRPVRIPGRGPRLRERAPRDVFALVEGVSDAISEMLDRPFALVGHCLGAVVAFEVARELRARGLPEPVHLFAAGRRAPQLPARGRDVASITDDEVFDHLRETGAAPPELLSDRAAMHSHLPAIRTDLRLDASYRYRGDEPLSCPITVYAGTEDDTSSAALEAWSVQTSSSFEIRRFEGDHFFFRTQEVAMLDHVRGALLGAVT